MKDLLMILSRREWASDDKDAIFAEFKTKEPYTFVPGQYMRIRLIDPLIQDEYGTARIFNMATSPSNVYAVGVVTRLRGTAFKTNLRDMPIGTEVSVSSPLGEFVLHKDTEIPVVFLIGGTGIAPVMSMLSDIEEQKIPYKITLFYSNKTIGRMVFSKELERQSERGVITRHVRTLTQTETPPQGYQKGRINEEMITKSMTPEELSRAIFYVSGPWGMGESMRAVLKNIGVRDEQIHVKEFDLNWLKK